LGILDASGFEVCSLRRRLNALSDNGQIQLPGHGDDVISNVVLD